MNLSWRICLAVMVVLIGGVQGSTHGRFTALLKLRGGLVPQAKESGGDYFEQFHLDYGSKDNKRVAGAMRGFIASGKLTGLPESDPFFKWLNEHLEKGPESVSGRLKPFYAADFGTKKDLKKGENPKVMIVQRKLVYDKNGVLAAGPPSSEIDVEVREVWQPWLKSKCNFVARYIVPSRVNIIKIMESQGRFLSELEIDQDDRGRRTAWAKMTFKPTLAQRLSGKRDVVIRRKLDASKLSPSNSVQFSSKAYSNSEKTFPAAPSSGKGRFSLPSFGGKKAPPAEDEDEK